MTSVLNVVTQLVHSAPRRRVLITKMLSKLHNSFISVPSYLLHHFELVRSPSYVVCQQLLRTGRHQLPVRLQQASILRCLLSYRVRASSRCGDSADLSSHSTLLSCQLRIELIRTFVVTPLTHVVSRILHIVDIAAFDELLVLSRHRSQYIITVRYSCDSLTVLLSVFLS